MEVYRDAYLAADVPEDLISGSVYEQSGEKHSYPLAYDQSQKHGALQRVRIPPQKKA